MQDRKYSYSQKIQLGKQSPSSTKLFEKENCMRLCMMLILFLIWQSIGWANDEYSLYQDQGSRCGEKNNYIVKEAFQNYNQWKTARDNGYKAPPNTFRTAGQQFEYLYKNGCDDGLVLYRYRNMMRHNNKCNESISVLLESIKDLKTNYPSYVSWAYYSLGMCSTIMKRYDDNHDVRMIRGFF